MKAVLLSLVLFVIIGVSFAQEQDTSGTKTISSTQTSLHIGDTLWIEGTVSQVVINQNAKGSPAYLNFGGRFPNHHFTVLIWLSQTQEFQPAQLKALEGKEIKVYGVITEYRGKPQVVYGKGVLIEF